eukprot:Hpha_TRINITY_DN16585_c3_g1::TRINITY_DN16585_c3_g1_i1::g.136404::m.136404/K01517/ADPRM; manganese-dependent ADP-ribose/CDP-alcohol diphosphatase
MLGARGPLLSPLLTSYDTPPSRAAPTSKGVRGPTPRGPPGGRLRRRRRRWLVPLLLVVAGVVLFLLSVWPRKRVRGRGATEDGGLGALRCSLGVVSDIQYADRGDGFDVTGEHRRYYRGGLKMVARSAARWRNTGITKVLDLGDAIDGSNAGAGTTSQALSAVASVFSPFERLRVQGNHDLYNQPPDALNLRGIQNMPVCAGWRLVLFDAYDLSVLEGPSAGFEEARQMLMTRNPNLHRGNMTPGAAHWLEGIEGTARRWTPLNGAVRSPLLALLDAALAEAEEAGESVVVASHIPVLPGAAGEMNLLWNYEAVLRVLQERRSVVLYLAGHDHDGGLGEQDGGPLHVTMRSPLEAPPDARECAATLDFHSGGVFFKGHGCMQDSRFAARRRGHRSSV